MAKKQNFYYTLVMTNHGPVFVTEVDRTTKTARWEKDKKPLEMGKYWAEDLTLGLNLNFNLAFTVCSKFELDNQPYYYSKGQFKWEENTEDSNKKEGEHENG